jgi:GDP-L-fucose synthase
MSSLASIIAEVVGYKGGILWDKTKPNGQPRRALDISKTFRDIGWIANTGLADGLKKTYESFLKEVDHA